MKKLLSILLVLAMTLSVVAAASAETHEFDTGETIEILTDADGNVVDLGGMEIIIGDWWSGEPAEPTTAEEEATLEYRNWIQETYNFTLKQQAVSSWEDNPSFFADFATTQGEENIVFILRNDVVASPFTNGLLYDLATLDNLDFSDTEKWNSAIRDVFTVGDSVYAMYSGASEPRDGVYFNKRLLEEAGIDPETIYDMQADGTWTWEAMEDLFAKVTRDIDNDGVIDVYAFASQSASILWPALAGNDASFVKRGDDNLLYNASFENQFLETCNWIRELWINYGMPMPADANWDWTFAAFYNGDVVFTPHQYYFAHATLKDQMVDDYGFVMFPVGPQGDTCKTVYQNNITVLPAFYDKERAEKIAFAYDLWTNPTPGYDDPDAWMNAVYGDFRDDRAVEETVAMMRDADNHGVVFLTDLVPGMTPNDLGSSFHWNVFGTSPGVTVMEQLETAKPDWDALIDAANGK